MEDTVNWFQETNFSICDDSCLLFYSSFILWLRIRRKKPRRKILMLVAKRFSKISFLISLKSRNQFDYHLKDIVKNNIWEIPEQKRKNWILKWCFLLKKPRIVIFQSLISQWVSSKMAILFKKVDRIETMLTSTGQYLQQEPRPASHPFVWHRRRSSHTT